MAGDLSTFYTGISTTPKKLASPTLGTKVANSTPATLSGMLAPKPIAAPVTTFVGGVPVSQTPPWTGSVGQALPSAPVVATAPVAPSTAPLFSGSQPTGATGPAPTGATGATGTSINPAYLNADGSFKTPAEIAATVGSTLKAAHGSADIGTLAGEQFGPDGGTSADAEAAARRITNTRNDIAVGDTDPYGVGATSGIQYTPAELNAIESAYAGIYDPALDSALAKVTQKQASEKSAADQAAQLAQIKAQGDQTRETQQAAPYTLGQNDVRYDSNGQPIAAGSAVGASEPGSDLQYYIKTTANGNQYVDLSTVLDKDQKAALQNAAQAAGIPPVTDANASKINAIDDTRSNLYQIANQFQKVGYQNGLTKTLGGGGISNDIEGFFGDQDIGSFNAWRTAAINSIQALAGGTGSGLRINQAEINSAMDNDIPNKDDTIAVGNAKIAVLKKQLDNWENQLLGTTGSGATGSKAAAPISTPDGKQWTQNADGSYTQVFNPVGNTTASKTSMNIPQRNNNPGNVKAGGLSDALATGKDQYGHLIFPDAATGFKALTADLTAKINGGSSHLPANPTIAQLGSVYAEDPNWPVKVAKLLGVTINTPTKNVPIAALAKAVATQEGFYA